MEARWLYRPAVSDLGIATGVFSSIIRPVAMASSVVFILDSFKGICVSFALLQLCARTGRCVAPPESSHCSVSSPQQQTHYRMAVSRQQPRRSKDARCAACSCERCGRIVRP